MSARRLFRGGSGAGATALELEVDFGFGVVERLVLATALGFALDFLAVVFGLGAGFSFLALECVLESVVPAAARICGKDALSQSSARLQEARRRILKQLLLACGRDWVGYFSTRLH